MKKIILCAFSVATFYGSATAQTQIINIPDTNFKKALLDYDVDANSDGEIQKTEAESQDFLNIEGSNISSLEGIEHFVNITTLRCNSNSITTLDVSKNLKLNQLYCYDNLITALDVSKNVALVMLDCYENSIAALDVSNNLNLIGLNCVGNKITSLDVSKNLDLRGLYCEKNLLSCIQLNESQLSNINETWSKDDEAEYSLACGTTTNLDSNDDFSGFSIYPNPFESEFFITNSVRSELDKLELFSLSGTLLKTLNSSKTVHSLDEFPSGSYILKISGDNRISNTKIVKL